MRLSDCFIDLVAYVSYMIKTVERKQPSYEQVRSDIQRMITESEEHTKKADISQEDFDLARFAIFAWIDETILSSLWNEKGQWQVEKLQYQYYNTSDAGEIFFQKLNALGFHQKDVREVYYLCLAMGFMGQYCHEGDEFLLNNLKEANLKVLTGSSIGIPSLEKEKLFSEAYPIVTKDMEHPETRKMKWGVFTLFCIGFPVLLYGFLFFLFQILLESKTY